MSVTATTAYPFGAVYLLEQGRSFAEMERDLDIMRSQGYNLVTVWPVANAWLAAHPDEFRFEDTRRLLDLIHARGMKAILQLIGQNQSQEYLPDCLMKPEMRVVDPRATGSRQTWHNCFWANLNHPEVDAAVRRYLGAAITALKDHPALVAWDLFNEAHLRTDDPWTIALYRDWLQEKYGSIENLNTRWYRRYRDFAGIDPADRNAPYSVWSSILPSVEYEQFRSEILTAVCARWVRYAKEFDPVHPMLIDGTSGQLLEGDVTGRNNDEYATAETCDIFGGTYYPKSWGRNLTDQPWVLSLYYLCSATAARRAGKPFWITELQTHTQSALTPGSEVAPAELAAWIWMGIAEGANAFQLWRQRPFLHGYQSTGRGLTTLDGTPGPRAAAVTELVRELRRHEALITAARPVPPTVKILFSYRSRLIHDCFQNWSGSTHPDALKGWYRAFWSLGIPTEPADLARLTEADLKTPVLVLPSVLSLADDQIVWLRRYVEQGGSLIADARLNTVDDFGVVRAEGPPGTVLQEVFGCRERDTAGPVEFTFAGETVTGAYLTQQLELLPGAEALASTADGRPMLVHHHFDRGRTFYFAAHMGQTFQKGLPPKLCAFLRDVCREAAPEGFEAELSGPAHVRIHAVADGRRLAYLIPFGPEPVAVTLSGLGKTRAATVLADGRTLDVRNGRLSLTLAPGGVTLLAW